MNALIVLQSVGSVDDFKSAPPASFVPTATAKNGPARAVCQNLVKRAPGGASSPTVQSQ